MQMFKVNVIKYSRWFNSQKCPLQILCISVYGAWMEAATSTCITSLDRARFDQSDDTNNFIFNF